MKVLALEKEARGVTADACTPHLKAEAAEVLSLYEQGIIREIYFTRSSHEAVVILESSSLDEARSLLGRLPLVRNGLVTFEVDELVPYDGFSRLVDRR